MVFIIGNRITDLRRSAGILLLSAMAVIAVSCGGSGDTTQDIPEPLPPQPNGNTPIAFNGSLSEGESETHARTRATTSPLSASHHTFYAWAYKNPTSGSPETVMRGFVVNWLENSAGTTTTNSRGWEYVNQQTSSTDTEQSIKYWDFAAADYRFFGYAGSGVSVDPTALPTSVSFSIGVDARTANLETLSSVTPLYSKLWYKSGTQLTSDPVQLVFLQPYARVRFMFVAADPVNMLLEDMNLEDPHFKPDGTGKTIAIGGTFTVTYPLTSAGGEKEDWDMTPGVSNDDKMEAFTQDYYETPDDANAKYWYTVIPVKTQGTFTLSVNVQGELKTCVVPEKYMTWNPGYSYTYIFKVNADGGVELGEVMSAYIDWKDGKEADHTIYNW